MASSWPAVRSATAGAGEEAVIGPGLPQNNLITRSERRSPDLRTPLRRIEICPLGEDVV